MGIPIIGDVINAVKDIVSEVVVDKDKKIEINYRLQELADKESQRFHEELMAQIDVNKQEATHSSIFVAGWRPAIGWICATGLGWAFVLSPFIEWISRVFGFAGAMPEVDVAQLMVLITGMLGLGSLRTYEKVTGVASSSPIVKEKGTTKAAPSEKPKKRFKL